MLFAVRRYRMTLVLVCWRQYTSQSGKAIQISNSNLYYPKWHKRQKPMLSAAGLSGRACVRRMRSGEEREVRGKHISARRLNEAQTHALNATWLVASSASSSVTKVSKRLHMPSAAAAGVSPHTDAGLNRGLSDYWEAPAGWPSASDRRLRAYSSQADADSPSRSPIQERLEG